MAARINCPRCPRSFRSRDALTDHKRDFHGSGVQATRPFAGCNECSKRFPTIGALLHHQMAAVNHVRPAKAIGSFSCNDCGSTKRDHAALEQHRIATHSLILLAESDPRRIKLEETFISNWRKNSRRGPILAVFEIHNPGWRVNKYAEYKKRTKEPNEEVIHYHGTHLVCDLGAGANSKLCPSESCRLCGIIRSGFKSAKARVGWLRFGRGIYTTATSGKSDDYIPPEASRRAVLLCKVAAGRKFRTTQSMPDLENPPEGYDSVSGEVGQDLNYDETVVYSRHAILPYGMIVYARGLNDKIRER